MTLQLVNLIFRAQSIPNSSGLPSRQWTLFARVVVNHLPTGNLTTSALIVVVNGAQDKGDDDESMDGPGAQRSH
jgi:hypothetical protein